VSQIVPHPLVPGGPKTDSKPGYPATPASLAASASALNFKQRVASALVMATVAIAVVYAGVVAFAVLLAAIALLMSWEWGHLVRSADMDLAVAVHAASVAGAIGLTAFGLPLMALVVLLVGALAVVALTQGERPLLSALGVAYVGLPAIAMVWLRADTGHGFEAIVFLLVVVWTTDTMAFVCGRAIGGPKLWPTISPNKTWAGFLGGVVCSALAGAAFALVVPGASSLTLGAIGLLLGIVAQGGDLAESALKREFNVKDASHLIPGHGGVMDRMDGVVTVAIAAGLLALVLNAKAPAGALLLGG
jgi:phosphatidate cytidylyltransferase